VGLGPDEGQAQGQVPGIEAPLGKGVEQVKGVAGNDVDDGGAELLQELKLARGVARARGYGQGHQPFGAVMKAQPPGKQPVAHHVLKHIPGPHPGHVHAPGYQVGPGGDVFPGVVDHRGLAGGPRGGMEAHHLGKRPGQHIPAAFPQVVLRGKREAAQVFQAPEPFRGDPGLFQALAAERAGAGSPDGLLKARQLQFL
jgi:hypothetical protein